MKKAFIIYMVFFVFISCHKDNLQKDEQMKFSMFVNVETKATSEGFDSGDIVGLYVVEYNDNLANTLQIAGNWANNISTTFDGTEWVPSKKIYWSDNLVDVYGYYPYMKLTSVDEQPFAIALDQNAELQDGTLGGYEASDLLWAKTEKVAQDQETVTLTYKHIMSKIVIKLVKGSDYEGDLPKSSEIYIHNVVPNALIDFCHGTVIKDPYGTESMIKARRVDDETFEAIIVPQRLESRRPFVELITEGVSYLLEDTFYFRNGKVHILELTINSNPDQVSVEIGGSIEGEW